jgi:hypothetical protein
MNLFITGQFFEYLLAAIVNALTKNAPKVAQCASSHKEESKKRRIEPMT